MTYLPNIDLASGPFWLFTINEATGSGILDRNVNYFRSAWYDNLTSNEVSSSSGTVSLTSYPSSYIYNAGASSNMSIGAGDYGYVNMTSANLLASNGGNAALSGMTCSASAQAHSGSVPSANIFTGKAVGSPINTSSASETPGFTVSCGGNGQIVVSITPHAVPGMTKGIYEVTVTGSYTFLGEVRRWIQFFGIEVAGPSTTSTTSTTTSPSSSSSSSSSSTSSSSTTSIPEFPAQLGIAAVVTTFIVVAYAFARRVNLHP
ncbi:MAG: hypothetical protein ACLQEQ_00625 [Nitrososphaerales archaeon]